MPSRTTGPLDDALPLEAGPSRPLPVAWDGEPIDWSGFRSLPPVFICPPQPREPCPTCGILDPPVVSEGRTASQLLVAHRCTACRLDTVRDRAGTWWTLDDTDYGPAGSSPP